LRTIPLKRADAAAPPRPVMLAHVAGLDAPLVALVWQEAIARAAGISMAPAERIVLALAVWLAYTADRWLDVRRAAASIETPRHRFARHHHRAVALVWGGVLAAAVTVAVLGLELRVLVSGCGLVLLVLAYTIAVHAVRARWPKEIATAALFALGTGWFVIGRSPGPLGLGLALFGALVALNCLSIGRFEYERDRRRGEPAWLAPAGLERLVLGGGGSLVVSALAAGLLFDPLGPFAAGVALAALGLLSLHVVAERLAVDTLRIGADVALLAPVLVWILP